MANEWVQIDDLSLRLSVDRHPLTETLLGLDFDDRRYRLRAAVARAYQATWRYADVFCDWCDARKASKQLLPKVERFIDENWVDLLAFAQVRDNRSWGINSREVTRVCLNDLSDFYHESKRWVEAEDERAKQFPRNAPRLFLIGRLAEVYACFSGRVPPNHLSGKATKSTVSPDARFRQFLEPALTVVGYPTPTMGLDDVMRDLAKYLTLNGHYLNRLGKFYEPKHQFKLDYADFPTVGLLNGLNCFSDEEL